MYCKMQRHKTKLNIVFLVDNSLSSSEIHMLCKLEQIQTQIHPKAFLKYSSQLQMLWYLETNTEPNTPKDIFMVFSWSPNVWAQVGNKYLYNLEQEQLVSISLLPDLLWFDLSNGWLMISHFRFVLFIWNHWLKITFILYFSLNFKMSSVINIFLTAQTRVWQLNRWPFWQFWQI